MSRWTTIAAVIAILAVVATIGCARKKPMAPWVAVAREAKVLPQDRVDLSATRLATLPSGAKARAEAVLDEMAATTPDAAGIRRARELLAAALPAFADPRGKSGGEDPTVGTVKQCALVLFHGLLRRAGAAAKAAPNAAEAAAALVDAARGIEGFRASLVDDMLTELADALGPELQARATAPVADAGSAPDAIWPAVARRGQMMPPDIVDSAEKRLASRPGGVKARAEPVLDAMARTTPDAAGIQHARALLAAALPGFHDPKSAYGGGDEPDVGAVKQCALVLFHGLLARAGAAVKGGPSADERAVALVDAARGIEGFDANRRQGLLDELMRALGPDAYERASRKLDARDR